MTSVSVSFQAQYSRVGGGDCPATELSAMLIHAVLVASAEQVFVASQIQIECDSGLSIVSTAAIAPRDLLVRAMPHQPADWELVWFFEDFARRSADLLAEWEAR